LTGLMSSDSSFRCFDSASPTFGKSIVEIGLGEGY
jgi:hypothetical protein